MDTVFVSHWQPSRVTCFAGPAVGIAWTTDDSGLVFSHAANDGPVLDEVLLRDGSLRRLSFAPSRANDFARGRSSGLRFVPAESIFTAEIFLIRLARGCAFLTTREQDNPQYSPDGKRIAFASSRGGSREILARASLGQHQTLRGLQSEAMDFRQGQHQRREPLAAGDDAEFSRLLDRIDRVLVRRVGEGDNLRLGALRLQEEGREVGGVERVEHVAEHLAPAGRDDVARVLLQRVAESIVRR